MPTQTLIKNDFVTMVFHEESGIVHHEIHKYVYGEPLRALLTTGTDALEKHRATKWLSDDRKNNALSKEDTEWAMHEWSPRTIAAGWKHWAVVLPEKILGQMNMQRFIDAYAEHGVTVRIFTDPVEARAWLEST